MIKTLPRDSAEYFEILGKSDTVSMRSGMVTLAPGQDVGAHSTENYEELLIVLDGAGELNAAGSAVSIRKGQVAYNQPRTIHNVKNTGTIPLRYIYVVAKAVEGQ